MNPLRLRPQPTTPIDRRWPWRRRARVWTFLNVVPHLVHAFWYLIHATLRWRIEVAPEAEALIRSGKAAVFPFWHGDLFLSASISRLIGVQRRTVVMVGLSQAGEVQTRILKRLGSHVVRGARKARAIEAMEDMLDAFEQGAIAGITVDGSSGPAGVVKPGVVTLARLGRVPILPMGFQVDRKWVLNTWDSFIVPKPFAKCVVNIPRPMEEGAVEEGGPGITVEQVAESLRAMGRGGRPWAECRKVPRI